MIRLVLGLVLLFLGFAMATALVVQAVRRKRSAAKLRRPFETRTHAGTESTYWQTKHAPDATRAITRTSGRLPDPLPEGPVKPGVYAPYEDVLKSWTVDYTRPKSVNVAFEREAEVRFEEWAPKHPLGWRVVKVDAIYYAVSSKCPAEVQRYSPSMLGWVKEEDLGAWGEAVWASIQMPPMGQA